MGHGLSCSGGVLQLSRGKAALGLLAADVHLQKNVLNDVLLFRLFFNGFQQGERPHGLDQGHLAHHLLNLVPLKMTDEVERCAVIGVLAQLLRHLLDPVFAQHVDPGGDGLPAGGGVIHLAGAYQRDLLGVPAAFSAGGGDPLTDLLNICLNGHRTSLSFFMKQLFRHTDPVRQR